MRLDTARRDVPHARHLQRRRRPDSRYRAFGHRHPARGDARVRLDRGRAWAHPQLPAVLGAVQPARSAAASPVQLLFFDHNIPIGTPTPNPKPLTTVLSATDDVVTVQYQWQVAGDSACCPTGKGTVQYQIGAGGKLVTRGAVPNQNQ
jgi:LppP/LprE lipoprotein